MSTLARRTLGRTGLTVTRLGLAAFSVDGWGRRGPRLSADDVERAFHEHGITTFLVHSMMAEVCEGVRRLIRAGHRDELVLVSEASLPFSGSVQRSLRQQLRVLGTDHLDVWLLGWVRNRWYVRDAVWGTMCLQRQRGEARAIGFSSHNRPLAAALARELPADVLMIRYNAAHRGAEREVFAALSDLGDRRPGIIAYTATRWGMLLQPLPSQGFANGMTAPECYRFVLAHPLVDMAWCAATSAAQLSDDAAAVADGPLPAARMEQVIRFGDAVHAAARGGRRWMFGVSSS